MTHAAPVWIRPEFEICMGLILLLTSIDPVLVVGVACSPPRASGRGDVFGGYLKFMHRAYVSL